VVSTTRGPFSAPSTGDLIVYDAYHSFLHARHLLPFRDFPFEYPPGALVPIWLVGGDVDRLSFFMAGCAIVCQLSAWALGGWRAGWLMVAVAPVCGALVRTHFDLLPTALALAGLALALRRPGRGAVEAGLALLAVGAMTKLWPGAVAALVLIWLAGRGEARLAVRAGVVFAAVVLAIGLPFAAVGGFPSAMLRFHLDRPVQIESSTATVLEIAGGSRVTGDPIRPDAFKSNGLEGGLAGPVLTLSTLALLAVAAALAVLVARRPDEDALLLAVLGVVIAFVALGKVLSPQYMCWLVPLAAVLAGRGWWTGPALVAAASLMTQLWFPGHYMDLVFQHPRPVVLVGVRNLTLLLALAATVRALARWPAPAAVALRR
jgi:hypothetical protein